MRTVSDFELNLDPPFFLVAMPQVLDPFFHRAVVVVLEHHSGGSFGYIVNRPTEFALHELLEGLGIEWAGPDEAIGWFGGPVQTQMGTALFERPGERIDPRQGVVLIREPLHLTADIEVIRRLSLQPPANFRLILGYSGWGPGQLDQEMDRNDWLVAPFESSILFASKPEDAWTQALESIDVRPESLPAWISGDPGTSN